MKPKRLIVLSCILTFTILSVFLLSSKGIQAFEGDVSAVAAPAGTTFTVNNTFDAVDSNPGNGVCSAVASICTLRAAIQEVNAYPGDDTIVLPAGIYTLTIGGRGEDNATTGDLDITSNLTITGVSSQTTIIDANYIDRIFEVMEDVTVTISNLTLRQGEPGLTYVGQANNGGAIRNMGTLMINDSAFYSNRANNGGGIMNGTGAPGTPVGILNVNRSYFSNNSTFTGGGGGGIRNEYSAAIRNSLFIGNMAADASFNPGGGGFLNDFLGTVSIDNSTFTNNISNYGGAMTNGGVMTVTNSTLSANFATQSDGGGGISNRSHAAGYAGTVTLINSTLSMNSASNGSGGGIVNQDNSSFIIINSTLSENNAASNGGGIMNSGGTLDLNNVTIVSNTTSSSGGGIYRSGGIVYPRNTLLAQNSGTGGSPDCFGSILSGGYNLVGNNAGCSFGSTTGDQVGTAFSPIDPLIGTLQANGGSTWTRGLIVGSPAIDLGNPIAPGSNSDACATVDQRGISRPQGSACDVGAFEAPAVPICIAQSAESDIILIIDRSGSMGTGNKLDDAKAAVTTFLSSTNAPPDQVGLVSFASDATLDQPLTTTKEALITATQLLTASGNTRIDLALMTARIELTGSNHILTHSKVIILLTDGMQNPAGNDPVITETNIAKAEGAVIFTIGLGPDADTALLQQIATDANHYYFAPTGAELADIYQQISSAIGCPDIGGQAYVDRDNDGHYTAITDLPAPGLELYLTGPNGLRATTSQTNGRYVFANNFAGTYTLTVDILHLPINYLTSSPISYTLGLTSADSLDNDFILTKREFAFLPIVNLNYCSSPIIDDFSSSTSGWPVSNGSPWANSYTSGEYRMLAKAGNTFSAVSRGERQFGPMILEVDTRVPSGATGSMGIVFGVTDTWNELYTFEVYPPLNLFVMWHRLNGSWSVVTYGQSGAIQAGHATNHIRLTTDGGNTLTAYVNGTYLMGNTVPYNQSLGRRVGLTATSDANGFDARFDNYKLVKDGCPEFSLNQLQPAAITDPIFSETRSPMPIVP